MLFCCSHQDRMHVENVPGKEATEEKAVGGAEHQKVRILLRFLNSLVLQQPSMLQSHMLQKQQIIYITTRQIVASKILPDQEIPLPLLILIYRIIMANHTVITFMAKRESYDSFSGIITYAMQVWIMQETAVPDSGSCYNHCIAIFFSF